jgi:hypothetical protein
MINKMKDVTVDMIVSFRDIENRCLESYPCQHGPFEILLKDGRITRAKFNSYEIGAILEALKEIGIKHVDCEHFSSYFPSGITAIRSEPADVLLNEAFTPFHQRCII